MHRRTYLRAGIAAFSIVSSAGCRRRPVERVHHRGGLRRVQAVRQRRVRPARAGGAIGSVFVGRGRRRRRRPHRDVPPPALEPRARESMQAPPRSGSLRMSTRYSCRRRVSSFGFPNCSASNRFLTVSTVVGFHSREDGRAPGWVTLVDSRSCAPRTKLTARLFDSFQIPHRSRCRPRPYRAPVHHDFSHAAYRHDHDHAHRQCSRRGAGLRGGHRCHDRNSRLCRKFARWRFRPNGSDCVPDPAGRRRAVEFLAGTGSRRIAYRSG